MKHFKRLVHLLFLLTALIFTGKFCKQQTDTFTIHAISSSRPYNPEFTTRDLTEGERLEVEEALNQPYVYFGCGGQAYVIFSGDGKYVVKFFKQRLLRPSLILNYLPLPKFLHRYRQKKNWKRLDKLKRDFFSYKTAFEKLQPQTGVIYVHLNPTDYLNTELEIIDRLGIHHHLDLDSYDFIVQRRAERVHDRMNRLMEEENPESAIRSIHSVIDLISLRAKKGYRDRDPGIHMNCGFLEEQAVKIDVGRFVECPEMQTKERHNSEILRVCAPFGKWLAENHPRLLPAYQEHLEEVLE